MRFSTTTFCEEIVNSKHPLALPLRKKQVTDLESAEKKFPLLLFHVYADDDDDDDDDNIDDGDDEEEDDDDEDENDDGYS